MGRRQQLIFTGLLATGVAMFVLAALVSDNNTPDAALGIPGVEQLIPQRDDEVLQQQHVGIDLEAGYRLVMLTISPDARCLAPVDVTQHVRRVEGLQQFTYQPTSGLPVEALAPDQNCVIATIEEIALPGVFEEIEWVFTVS